MRAFDDDGTNRDGVLNRYSSRLRPSRSSPADHEPRENCGRESRQQPWPMLHHRTAERPYNLRPKPKHKDRQNQKAHEPSQKNRHQEVAKAHFKNGRTQHEDFEGRRWRQHPGKHQRPEFVLLERAMNFQKALLRNPLAQHFLAAQIADDVQRNAAQRGAQRRHRDVKQKPRVVLIDVAWRQQNPPACPAGRCRQTRSQTGPRSRAPSAGPGSKPYSAPICVRWSSRKQSVREAGRDVWRVPAMIASFHR